MNVLRVLRKDHDTIKRLFSKFESTPSSDFDGRWNLFDRLRTEITFHSKVEEEILYPVLKSLNDSGRKLVYQALKEHKQVDQLMDEIALLNPQDQDRFADRVTMLFEDLEHHVEEEEGQMFRLAEENCPESQLIELGFEIQRRKRALERRAAA